MENKLDKLFRDKLEHHSLQSSLQAWEKVAASFPKKNNTWVAWRIAAAIAIVGVISLLILSPWKVQESSTLAKEVKKETETIAPAESKKSEAPQVIQEEPKTTVTNKSRKTTAPKLLNRPAEQPIAEIKQEIVEPQAQIVASTTTESPRTEIKTSVDTKQSNVNAEKTLVIVYSLAPVETKPAEEPVKTKPLQRMFTFAKDVKGGDATLASVRDWKDNFFGSEETARVEKQTSNN